MARTSGSRHAQFSEDIYTEPTPEVNTLANLGPLTWLAGIWTGAQGTDINPKPAGSEWQSYIEHIKPQPVDRKRISDQVSFD